MTVPASDTRATSAPSLSIVLVHGAFVDGSGRQGGPAKSAATHHTCATVSEIDSSHAAMLSHPHEVADFIAAAAATLA
ncbi:hypothetical protein PMI04_010560 [Sphingobium sp. AP49]|uniref:hypothetical protein n=1 Tax=Sphingobium sp. AP49 TaxID=1144307 RepID=UPI00026EDF9A|nr:hypothetical protein [Sphingobium sp. AP49]WHO40987.1 hypothetical protein PMI04_010560 [Sphingobium sp. AP49]